MEKLMPTSGQLKFLEWETGMFFHFGIRSANHGHQDWDGVEMAPETFRPDRLDCDQWMQAAKLIGAKYAIMTAKHHDGFALWPSAYTRYSVAASPWRGGKGDVVKEFTDACRRNGLAVGLYYSPAQWGSTAVKFDNAKEYDDYFINQISELLSNYGKIDYLWFDGCGSDGHEYDQKRIVNVIRSLQPEILIFSMWDPDTRWVGNEDGYAPMRNLYEQELNVLGENKRIFAPAECDCKLRERWFYDLDEDTTKSVEELVGMYELSVGRGSNLLLNVGPDETGRVSGSDMKRLSQFRAELDRRYGCPIDFGAVEDSGNGVYTVELSEDRLNRLDDIAHLPLCTAAVIEEDITQGQAVRGFRLYAHMPCRQPLCVCCGETIGHKAIIRFPAIRSPKFTLEILESSGKAKIRDIRIY